MLLIRFSTLIDSQLWILSSIGTDCVDNITTRKDTMTPGGFEGSFKDRAELIKTVKPDDPNFIKMREQMMTQRKYDREYLGDWTPKKINLKRIST